MFLAFQTSGSICANEGRREEEVYNLGNAQKKHSFFRGPSPALVFVYNKFLCKLKKIAQTPLTLSKDGCVLLVGLAASVSA